MSSKKKNYKPKKYPSGGSIEDYDPYISTGLNLVAPGSGTAYSAYRGVVNTASNSSDPNVAGYGKVMSTNISNTNPLKSIKGLSDGKGTFAGDMFRLTPYGVLADRFISGRNEVLNRGKEQLLNDYVADTSRDFLGVNKMPITKVDTTSQFMYPHGGIVNANAELEKEEAFQLPNGQLGQVDGPSHENGGVPVNLPEGTKIWSDRLKSGTATFATKANKISKKVSNLTGEDNIRKHDKISDNTVKVLNKQLDTLFNEQEAMKLDEDIMDTFKYGGMVEYGNGGIYIKPSKRGSFTKWAKSRGMSVQEAATKVMSNKNNYSDAIVKKANFAKNASSWKHPDGGIIGDNEFKFYEHPPTDFQFGPPEIDPNTIYEPIDGTYSPKRNAIGMEDIYGKPTEDSPIQINKSGANIDDLINPNTINKALPYIGPTNQLLSSFKKDKVNRIKNKEYSRSLNEAYTAEAMLPSTFDISSQLGELNTANRGFKNFVNSGVAGPAKAALLLGNKVNSVQAKSSLFNEKRNRENAMKAAKAEQRARISEFRARLGSEDANYQRQFDIDNLQDAAQRRNIRNSAISNLSSNKQQSQNDLLRIEALKSMFPNADMESLLKIIGG